MVRTLVVFVVFPVCLFAQRHELGVRVGGSSLVGDIGNSNFIFQRYSIKKLYRLEIPVYAGILYRFNFNPYQTLRFDFGINNVLFEDNFAKEDYRRNRRLWGSNFIYEGSLIFEYNFFPVNNEQKSMLSPYIFGGISGLSVQSNSLFFNNDFYRDADNLPVAPTADNPENFLTTAVYKKTRNFTMAIPFGIGLKYKFNQNWALSGEFMFRPTFSNAVDYSVVDEKNVRHTYSKDILQPGNDRSFLNQEPYKNIAQKRAKEYLEKRKIGNVNSKDWVNSFTLILTYSFGRPPCYCD
ncbi:MAG: hypothetical protein FDW93_04040 [Bergeyella sp.]|nr:hypothetical protein [Bergeyella sp.]